MTPSRARAPVGKRAVESVPSKRGEEVSVVAASCNTRYLMTATGQVPMMLKGSMDALAFEAWIAQALVAILLTGMVVFLDKVNFHVGPRVRELIERE